MIEDPKIKALLNDISHRAKIKDYLLVIYGEFNQDILVSAVKLIEKKLVLEKKRLLFVYPLLFFFLFRSDYT